MGAIDWEPHPTGISISFVGVRSYTIRFHERRRRNHDLDDL